MRARPIPSELGQLTALTAFLGLHSNQFSGPVPSELGRLTQMTADFDLSANGYLCGDVPPEVASLANHVTSGFDVATGNGLLGAACCRAAIPHPDTFDCPPSPQPTENTAPGRAALEALYAQCGGSGWRQTTNWLAATAPCDADLPWYGVTCNADATAVTRLELNDNSLVGSLPSQVGLLTGLTAYLRLDANALSGSLPTELGRLTAMTEVLYLWGNSFTGALPTQLGLLTALTRSLSFSSNRFSGSLPSELGLLTNLHLELRGAGNQFSGALPSELGRLTKMTGFFDFSSNLFCGDVPPEVAALEAQVGESGERWGSQ